MLGLTLFCTSELAWSLLTSRACLPACCQVYDLLNPAPLVLLNGRTVNAKPGQVPQLSGALRMRWSKAEDFYLENLFKVRLTSPSLSSSSG